MAEPVFLSREEVAQLCEPHRRADARRRFLERANIRFVVGAKGQPLVFRGQFLAKAGQSFSAPREPDANALKVLFAKARM